MKRIVFAALAAVVAALVILAVLAGRTGAHNLVTITGEATLVFERAVDIAFVALGIALLFGGLLFLARLVARR